jgi:hypothetical protein
MFLIHFITTASNAFTVFFANASTMPALSAASDIGNALVIVAFTTPSCLRCKRSKMLSNKRQQ